MENKNVTKGKRIEIFGYSAVGKENSTMRRRNQVYQVGIGEMN